MKVENKQDILLKSVKKFYKEHPQYWKLFVEIITKKNQISLRSIDHFCTSYARSNDIDTIKKKSDPVYAHEDYKGQLKAYSKLHFDMFRRHERINLPCSLVPEKSIETTVGQLNFFRWFFMRKIYEWMITGNNLKKVEEDMTKLSQKQKKIKQSFVKCAKRHNVDIRVTFR